MTHRDPRSKPACADSLRALEKVPASTDAVYGNPLKKGAGPPRPLKNHWNDVAHFGLNASALARLLTYIGSMVVTPDREPDEHLKRLEKHLANTKRNE